MYLPFDFCTIGLQFENHSTAAAAGRGVDDRGYVCGVSLSTATNDNNSNRNYSYVPKEEIECLRYLFFFMKKKLSWRCSFPFSFFLVFTIFTVSFRFSSLQVFLVFIFAVVFSRPGGQSRSRSGA